jgi:hypothetical protein
MSGLDRRTARDRDLLILAQIDREGGFSLSWLISNRDNAASLHRLIASGALRLNGSDWLPAWRDPVPALTWRESLREWARRMRVWMCGWNTDEGV